MEPTLCVLVYSKYSSECQKVFRLLQESGLNLSQQLQLLCIDNAEIRKKIQKTITYVPCVLCVFPPGVPNRIEKLEGPYAVTWIQKLIESAQPIVRAQPLPPPQAPPQQPPPPQALPQQQPLPQIEEENDIVEELLEERPSRSRTPSKASSRASSRTSRRRVAQVTPVPEALEELTEPETRSAKKHYTRRPVVAEELDEDPEYIEPQETIREALSDRHRSVVQPKRLRQNDQQYIESEELFSGEVPDARRPPSHVTKADTQNRTTQDPHGTMARAKALAMGRDEFDKESANPANRPMIRQN